MQEAGEFDHTPVPPASLQPARYFAASYAGEHIAGTEFVIGAAFVAWGASAKDVVFGLIAGNALAVLTWVFICAPIAVQTRLTLYAYLEKIAGPLFIKFYSAVNGVMFAILAGSMITVSASAVRIPLGVPPQTNWFPDDPAFVLVALSVGAIVVLMAVLGFKRLAQFATFVVPWMICMFLCGGLVLLPVLAASAGVSLNFSSLWTILDSQVYTENTSGTFTFWHVAAFAWVANLAMHGALGDMSLLRFAPKSEYGYFSALGMYIGHFIAWIAAGVMGAGAAVLAGKVITSLDAGEVAYQALGVSGIIAVVIAGWTTSNPTLYRAGLAFQSINPRWNRAWVTGIVGAMTTIIACFPFVFTQLLNFVGIMGLTLAPVGAVIVTEHWLFPKIGFTRYWRQYRGERLNLATTAAWATGIIAAFLLHRLGIHLFFLLIPTWLISTLAYLGFAALQGARNSYPEAVEAEQRETERRAAEKAYMTTHGVTGRKQEKLRFPRIMLAIVSLCALAACLFMSARLLPLSGSEFEAAFARFRENLIVPTVIFFLAALGATVLRERNA